MFALAWFDTDVARLVDEGLKAVDPRSEMYGVITDVRRWYGEHPDDWRATRKLLRDKYTRFKGDMPDRNGVLLNVGAATGAILYGQGDFRETVRLCFNFGWDADCTAATAGTLIGLIKGRKWMDGQGWQVKDLYANTTREKLPSDETISGYADRVVRLTKRIILENGGRVERRGDGGEVYIVKTQAPAVVERLPTTLERTEELRAALLPQIEKDLAGDDQARARAAYLAIALGEGARLRQERPDDWRRAVGTLVERYPGVVKNLFDAPQPRGALLRERATAAGLEKPPKPVK
jgi:hypothetical protein